MDIQLKHNLVCYSLVLSFSLFHYTSRSESIEQLAIDQAQHTVTAAMQAAQAQAAESIQESIQVIAPIKQKIFEIEQSLQNPNLTVPERMNLQMQLNINRAQLQSAEALESAMSSQY